MRIFKRIRWIIAGLLLFLIGSLPFSAFGEKALIRDVQVKRTEGTWKVGFTVDHCFTEKMEEAIRNGIETNFTFYVQIYQKRTLLWDRKVASSQFSHTLRFDPIRNEYAVTSGQRSEPLVTAALEEAKKKMARVEGAELRPDSALLPGVPTELRIKAELETIRLPFRLEYLFVFVSLWDFETDWHIEPLPM